MAWPLPKLSAMIPLSSLHTLNPIIKPRWLNFFVDLGSPLPKGITKPVWTPTELFRCVFTQRAKLLRGVEVGETVT
jgi:hypothetical protein